MRASRNRPSRFPAEHGRSAAAFGFQQVIIRASSPIERLYQQGFTAVRAGIADAPHRAIDHGFSLLISPSDPLPESTHFLNRILHQHHPPSSLTICNNSTNSLVPRLQIAMGLDKETAITAIISDVHNGMLQKDAAVKWAIAPSTLCTRLYGALLHQEVH